MLKLKFASKEDAKRRTEIVPDENEVSLKDLVPDAPCVITLSNRGYIKRVPLTEYRESGRGRRGSRVPRSRKRISFASSSWRRRMTR